MKKTFSLIELFIVIAIILIIASLLSPSLRKLTENANQVKCRNNLKNIYMGVMAWSEDNDDYTVPANWVYNRVIEQYTGASTAKLTDTYQCPSVTEDDMKSAQKKKTLTTYGVNSYAVIAINRSPGDLGKYDPTRGIWGKNMVYWNQHGVTKIGAIRHPSKIIYFMDSEAHRVEFSAIPFGKTESQYRLAARWHPYSPYGRKVSNIVKFDGTVSVEPYDVDTNMAEYLYE